MKIINIIDLIIIINIYKNNNVHIGYIDEL